MELESFQCIEMAMFDATTLSGTYKVLNGAAQQTDTGSVGFQDDIKIMKIYNDGSTGVILSFGATGSLTNSLVKQDYLPSKGTMIIDLQTNHKGSITNGTLNGRKGQLVYGKGTASSGAAETFFIYISGYR